MTSVAFKYKYICVLWRSADGQHQNQIDFLSSQRWSLYSQQKQDQEQTVAQIMNSLLPNSDIIKESRENH